MKSFGPVQLPFHAANTSRIPNPGRNFHNNVATSLSYKHSPSTSSNLARHNFGTQPNRVAEYMRISVESGPRFHS